MRNCVRVTRSLTPARLTTHCTHRRLDIDAVAALAWQLVAEHAPDKHTTATSSSSNGTNGSSVVLRAFLEVAPIRPMNGTFAIHSLGARLH